MRSFNRLYFIIVLFFSMGVVGSDSQASTITESFLPTDDAYVDLSKRDINYKNADLQVRYYNFTNFEREEISYLGFNVSLPSDANITEIKLQFRVSFPPLDKHTVHLIVYETSAFSEDTLTYANRPPLGILATEGDVAPTFELPAITAILDDYTFNASTKGYFLAIKTNTNHSSGVKFYSKSSASYSPKLVITYSSSQITISPTKTSLSVGFPLVGILLMGLIFRRKRN